MKLLTAYSHSVNALHFEDQLWENEIRFYNSELRIYQNRIQDIFYSLHQEMNLQKAADLYNQIVVQKAYLNNLVNDLQNHDADLALTQLNYSFALTLDFFPDHLEMQARIGNFKTTYSDLKEEISLFLNEIS